MIKKPYLVGCLLVTGCTVNHIAEWPVPTTAEEANSTTPPIRSFLDFSNFEADAEVEKARRATIAIQAVLNSAEFRCRVLSFDSSQRLDATYPGTGCLSDPARKDQDGHHQGFFWGLPPGSESAKNDYGTPIDNLEVYTRIVNSKEPHHPGEPDRIVRLTTALRSSLWHPFSIGSTDSLGIIHTNSCWFTRSPLTHLVGHWTHEYMHTLGFTHENDNSTGRPGSVPYAVGLFACQISKEYLSETYDSLGPDGCIQSMRGL